MAFARKDLGHGIGLRSKHYGRFLAEAPPVGWVEANFHRKGVELTMRAFGGNTADNGKKFDVKWA